MPVHRSARHAACRFDARAQLPNRLRRTGVFMNAAIAGCLPKLVDEMRTVGTLGHQPGQNHVAAVGK